MYNLFINRVLGLSCKMMKNVCHCQCYVGLFKVKLKSGTVDTRTIKLRYVTARAHPWSCLLERYEGNIPPFGKLFWQTQNNWTAHTWILSIHVWPEPGVHLLLLKNSMAPQWTSHYTYLRNKPFLLQNENDFYIFDWKGSS